MGWSSLKATTAGRSTSPVPPRKYAAARPPSINSCEDIDACAWDDLSGARVFYERMPPGTTVSGGMGGGKITDGLWVHGQLADMGLTARIAAVFDGSRPRLTHEPPGQPSRLP